MSQSHKPNSTLGEEKVGSHLEQRPGERIGVPKGTTGGDSHAFPETYNSLGDGGQSGGQRGAQQDKMRSSADGQSNSGQGDRLLETPVPGEPSVNTPTPEQALLVLLRRLRAYVQDMRDLLERIQGGTTTMEAESAYLQKVKAELATIGAALQPAMLQDDTMQHLGNTLEQIVNNPLLGMQEPPLTAQAQTNYQRVLLDQIQRIELWVGLIAIPARLNEWLAQANPGYYVPFHLIFQDELRDEADRQKLLNYLAWAPKLVKNGLVDVNAGVVFRHAEQPEMQRRSLFRLLALVGGSILLVMGAALLPIPLPAWTDALTGGQRATLFLVGWLALAIGVITHIGVESLKREQASGLPMVLSVSNLPIWVDAKIGQVTWKLVLILVGFFMVIVGLGTTSLAINAFLAGYSLDSFIGIFAGNITSRVASLHQHIKT